MRNIYADPAQAGTVKRLKAEMEALKQQLGDKDQFANALPADDVG